VNEKVAQRRHTTAANMRDLASLCQALFAQFSWSGVAASEQSDEPEAGCMQRVDRFGGCTLKFPRRLNEISRIKTALGDTSQMHRHDGSCSPCWRRSVSATARLTANRSGARCVCGSSLKVSWLTGARYASGEYPAIKASGRDGGDDNTRTSGVQRPGRAASLPRSSHTVFQPHSGGPTRP
jgi:hypothetical protein